MPIFRTDLNSVLCPAPRTKIKTIFFEISRHDSLYERHKPAQLLHRNKEPPAQPACTKKNRHHNFIHENRFKVRSLNALSATAKNKKANLIRIWESSSQFCSLSDLGNALSARRRALAAATAAAGPGLSLGSHATLGVRIACRAQKSAVLRCCRSGGLQ